MVRLELVDPASGQNILPLGASIRVGDVVLRTGAALRPIEIGVLGEIGHSVVRAIPRPRLAILATGNELVAVHETPAPGQIRNSNGPLLAAAVNRAGADAVELGIARDTPEDLRRWIEQGLAADVLVLSGGVSAGKFDLIPTVLTDLGVLQVFHKVALRPGKPLWFGVKIDGERQALVFGLPGNPVSSLVCFELFVRPAIAKIAGRGFESLPTVKARLSHAFDHAGGRVALLPAVMSKHGSMSHTVRDARNLGPDSAVELALSQMTTSPPSTLTVTILPWQGSADLATLARANCLARFSAEREYLTAGSAIEVMLL
jgi:molybdopterin molybdotransferase